MLRQAAFLGPAGTATWRSTSVQATGPSTFKAQGRLSLKGQTKSVPLTFKLRGNAQTKSVTGTASLDRTIFGIGSGEVAEALSPTVNVEFSFDAARN